MRILLLFISIFILFACENSTENSRNRSGLEKKGISNKIDSLIYKKSKSNILDSLVDGFDIDNFIKYTTMGLNSGIGSSKDYEYVPDTFGYFYDFYDPTLTELAFSKGLNPNQTKRFRISVFKFGKNTNEFSKQDEILIKLECYEMEDDLKTLNLIGQNISCIGDSTDFKHISDDTVLIESELYKLKCSIEQNTGFINFFQLIRKRNQHITNK